MPGKPELCSGSRPRPCPLQEYNFDPWIVWPVILRSYKQGLSVFSWNQLLPLCVYLVTSLSLWNPTPHIYHSVARLSPSKAPTPSFLLSLVTAGLAATIMTSPASYFGGLYFRMSNLFFWYYCSTLQLSSPRSGIPWNLFDLKCPESEPTI